ncbi:MAG: hypothetical protein KDD92_20765 [Caldilineaceae bacterium]|nr:hypothetical protein [Caldilineaceae bacterium]
MKMPRSVYIWGSYTAELGAGEFQANKETGELLFFHATNPPVKEKLRGHLTERLLISIQ